MTDLQAVFKTFINIIVSYIAEQQNNKELSVENLLSKPHQELIEEIKQLIATLEVTRHQTRMPLFTYLLFVVDEIKPLVDRTTQLTAEEYSKTQNTLVLLIRNLQLLMRTSHYKEEKIKYNNEEFSMHGFIRGALKMYSYCFSSQLLLDNFLTPWGIDINTDDVNIEKIVKTVLNNHQNKKAQEPEPLIDSRIGKYESLKEENARLSSKNAQLEVKMSILEEHDSELAEENARLLAENRHLQEENLALKERAPASAKTTAPPSAATSHPLNTRASSTFIASFLPKGGGNPHAFYHRAAPSNSSASSSSPFPPIF